MKLYRTIKIINKSTGVIIGDRIKYAGTFLLRLRGLLGCKSLEPGEGLLLYPCSSVHSFGMKISIDVVFMDQNLRIIKITPAMRPGLMTQQKGARYVLELGAGTIAVLGIKVNDVVSIEPG